jgi:hypothetical protein
MLASSVQLHRHPLIEIKKSRVRMAALHREGANAAASGIDWQTQRSPLIGAIIVMEKDA